MCLVCEADISLYVRRWAKGNRHTVCILGGALGADEAREEIVGSLWSGPGKLRRCGRGSGPARTSGGESE
jgi:hypothetical protein